MAHRACEYGDPLTILINRENRTCAGCQHELIINFGYPIKYCAKGKKHGKKCKLYREKK